MRNFWGDVIIPLLSHEKYDIFMAHLRGGYSSILLTDTSRVILTVRQCGMGGHSSHIVDISLDHLGEEK